MTCNIISQEFVKRNKFLDRGQLKTTDRVKRDFIFVIIGVRTTLFVSQLEVLEKKL